MAIVPVALILGVFMGFFVFVFFDVSREDIWLERGKGAIYIKMLTLFPLSQAFLGPFFAFGAAACIGVGMKLLLMLILGAKSWLTARFS